MKTLKSLCLLFIVTIAFYACDPYGSVAPPPPPFKTLPIAATVSLWGSYVPVDLENSELAIHLEFRGVGESDLMSKIIVETSHTEYYEDGLNSFQIYDGKFLIADESGNEIFGIYSGKGIKYNGVIEITEKCTIQGGSGEFLSAQGQLSVSVVDYDASVINGSKPMTATILGTIRLPLSQSNEGPSGRSKEIPL